MARKKLLHRDEKDQRDGVLVSRYLKQRLERALLRERGLRCWCRTHDHPGRNHVGSARTAVAPVSIARMAGSEKK